MTNCGNRKGRERSNNGIAYSKWKLRLELGPPHTSSLVYVPQGGLSDPIHDFNFFV